MYMTLTSYCARARRKGKREDRGKRESSKGAAAGLAVCNVVR
jgi:hypothetical protein